MSIDNAQPNKLRYRLALDMGSTSIGWCLVRIDKNNAPNAIIKTGVRIFSDGRNPKDGSSLAVTRRQARQMRRRRDRLLKRKYRLIKALIDLDFFPKDEAERQALAVLDPYTLRADGLDRALTGPEFARALFHINQRRGFLSNRKTDKKDAESGALKRAITESRKKLDEDGCRTIGEWLAKRHKNGESVRARLRGKTQKEKAYDFYVDRAMIEHEFDLIWNFQSTFNPSLYNENARTILKDILLFQRPLRPVKPGRCTLFPEQERAPLALPSTQQFRIYQELNNLRFESPGVSSQSLSTQQRDNIAALLEQGDLTFTKIARVLNLSGASEFNLQDVKRDRLKGNATAAVLAKEQHFGKKWHEFPLKMQDMIVDTLVNESSEHVLLEWLKSNTGIDEARAERIMNAQLPEGYGSLGREALSRILPELMKDVITYAAAVLNAGFTTHSALTLTEQTGEIWHSLPYYGEALQRHVSFGTGIPADAPEKRFGRIANPTVHIGLNELRKVVNALIERYGRPDEIIIELARELKLSHERKMEIQREQKEKQDRNEKLINDACEILGYDPKSLDKAKRRELSQKMQLWIELNPQDIANRRCPYSGEQLSLERLLSADVEIEHILPFSKTLDDSLNNKTIALRKANRDKGNRTPFEAFGQDLNPDYDYAGILERSRLMPREKRKRFAPDGYQVWLKEDKDFLARSLNDTAYLSRVAKEYLTLICPPNKVRAIPGRMTAQLRAMFGLNRLLSGSELKNRDDHRHHALDAAVIGVTDQGLLQRFANASARSRELQLSRLIEEMPLPWTSYREHVARAISNTTISHKPDHGYQGSIHEETAWGIADNGQATRRVRPEDGGHRQRKYENKNLVTINSTRNPDRHGVDETGQPNAYKGYVGGSNYCIEIWCDEKGKWNGEVISTYQAYQVIRALGEDNGLKKLRNPSESLTGKPLVMRLMINDTVRMTIENQRKIMRVATISKNGQIFFAEHMEANADARNRDKNNIFGYVSKTAGSLQKTDAHHATVSVIGEVRETVYRR